MDSNKTAVVCAIISGIVAVLVAYITSGAAFKQELVKEQANVEKVKQDMAAASSQAEALRKELATLAGQVPRTFKPAQGNCKPASDTPAIPGEPNVCGGDYFMTGINHEGKTVCCTLQAVY
jgi:hypothetical protein